MYNKLHYISQGNNIEEQLLNIQKVLDNGCDWIQLRFKNANTKDLHNLAEFSKTLCDEYFATLIINDHVHLAKQLDADGVHLGLQDMSILQAREILDDDKIIGGTANTFEDVVQRANENCDYIGLGPFRFSETKSNLSPILGLEGYQEILKKMQAQNIKTPIYAIGGIHPEDLESLLEIGIYGIAASGIITQQPEIITHFNEKFYVNS